MEGHLSVEADDKLIQTKKLYNLIADNVSDVIWTMDLDGRFTFVSPSVFQLRGYTPEEVMQQSITEALSPNSAQVVSEALQKYHVDGLIPESTFFELEQTRKDGSTVWTEVNVSIIRNKEGEPNGFLGVSRDITERKKVEDINKKVQRELETLANERKLLLECTTSLLKSKPFEETARQIFDACKKITGATAGYVAMLSENGSENKVLYLDSGGMRCKKLDENLPMPIRELRETAYRLGKSVYENNFMKSEWLKLMPKGHVPLSNIMFSPITVEHRVVGLIGLANKPSDFSERDAFMTTSFGNYAAIALKNSLNTQNLKEKRKQLQETGARYRTLFNQAPLGILLVDPQTNEIKEFNNIANEQLGYTRDEFAKLKIKDIEAKETPEEVIAHTLHMLREGGEEFETTHRNKNGQIRNVLVNTNSVTLSGKTYLQCIFHDITEIRTIQEDLIKSEKRANAIVENALIGIATSNQHRNFLTANQAFCKTLGYTQEELRKLTFKEITHPEDVKESLAEMQALEEGLKDFFVQEKRYIKKDGTIINGRAMINSIRDANGKPVLFIAELEDITERKKKDLELLTERNKLEAVTQSIGAGFVVISRDYRVLWANKFLNDNLKNLKGNFCYQALNHLNSICPDCSVKKVFEGAPIHQHEFRTTNAKGETVWLQLIATPLKDDKGNVVAAVEASIDITEKKKLENELVNYSMKLEDLVNERTDRLHDAQQQLVKAERLAAIGELATMVAHDLRNPLAGIRNAAYFLNKKGDHISFELSQEMLTAIDDGVLRSNKIINDLLDYSRDVHLERQECTPRQLVSGTLSTLQIPERIKIVNTVLNIPNIHVDSFKLQRVFSNIIKNAIDAIPEDGTVNIDSRINDAVIEISFQDTGCGIPEEILPKLFTPLVTTKAQGMGFGLAICKRIVEAHNGSITVKTIKGQGTTFTVSLPIKMKEVIELDAT